MTAETYRGVVQGGAIVLKEGWAPLPEGTEVLVTPAPPRPGTPTAVLAAMAAGPPVPAEWVDELMRAIEEGQRPTARDDPSADFPPGEGNA